MTQFNLYKMYVFMNMVITRVKNNSPDMILTGFDGKFHEKKDELPPEACRPAKKLRKNNVGPDRTGFFFADLFPDRTGPDQIFHPGFVFWTGPDWPGPDHPCVREADNWGLHWL